VHTIILNAVDNINGQNVLQQYLPLLFAATAGRGPFFQTKTTYFFVSGSHFCSRNTGPKGHNTISLFST
jgi:hypothetical protein